MFGFNKPKKEDIMEYDLNKELNNILGNLEPLPENTPTETKEDYIKRLSEEVQSLLQSATNMIMKGPEGKTPLAVIVHNEALANLLLSVMMAPTYTDTEKLQLIVATLCVAIPQYSISLEKAE